MWNILLYDVSFLVKRKKMKWKYSRNCIGSSGITMKQSQTQTSRRRKTSKMKNIIFAWRFECEYIKRTEKVEEGYIIQIWPIILLIIISQLPINTHQLSMRLDMPTKPKKDDAARYGRNRMEIKQQTKRVEKSLQINWTIHKCYEQVTIWLLINDSPLCLDLADMWLVWKVNQWWRIGADDENVDVFVRPDCLWKWSHFQQKCRRLSNLAN